MSFEKPRNIPEEQFVSVSKRFAGLSETEKVEIPEIQEYYASLPAQERANILYAKIIALSRTREEQGSEFTPNPELISEIQVLLQDEDVRKVVPEVYTRGRAELRGVRHNSMKQEWDRAEDNLTQFRKQFQELEKRVFVEELSPMDASAAQSQMERLARNVRVAKHEIEALRSLRDKEARQENTDVIALKQYEQLKTYSEQLRKDNFVWLPSRLAIHQKIANALLNHRWPLLVGEAGTGKSEQADAAARELTGEDPTKIACDATTGEAQLVRDMAIDAEGKTYYTYGELMKAFTGKENSLGSAQHKGRAVRLDESGRLSAKSYSILKEARQVRPGDIFYGEKVLKGATAILTTNPVGPRYPDRHLMDPAMQREVAEIYVDYPEMSHENPELFEFALASLINPLNGHIEVAKEELSPSFLYNKYAEDEVRMLSPEEKVVGEFRLNRDGSNKDHGVLWRFCLAVKDIQNSFVAGNSQTQAMELLRIKEDPMTGKLSIAQGEETGEQLKLSSATITLGEFASWLKGFSDRRGREDDSFNVDSLAEWLHFKVSTFLSQIDKADSEKIEAIMSHYGLLQEESSAIPKATTSTIVTPLDIGYLSPRVPRPLDIEKQILNDDASEVASESVVKKETYTDKEVMLESGEVRLIEMKEASIPEGVYDASQDALIERITRLGQKIVLNGEVFVYAGIVSDGEDKGRIAVAYPSGDLHKIVDLQDVRNGLLEYAELEIRNRLEATKQLDEYIERLGRDLQCQT